MEEDAPGKLRSASHEGDNDHGDTCQDKAYENHLWFTEFFDQPSGGAALKKRTHQSDEDDEITGRFSGVDDFQVKVVRDEERQSDFETTETKSGEEKDDDEHADFG